ncbi:hypothetical protein EVAR_81543_1 [Eumeta japonica]|uniref:Uncharacterized protein n=1 Tax=Eumeta variegata TaxID=151549 RepID=A0A4C1UZ80_EUMVA|nr:hypothetical protein EVAR_81543_1 [Eumeta japonica]
MINNERHEYIIHFYLRAVFFEGQSIRFETSVGTGQAYADIRRGSETFVANPIKRAPHSPGARSQIETRQRPRAIRGGH